MASGKFGHIASAQPGDVKYFAAAAAPHGWIKANGALVSRIAYAGLFAAIGTVYGAGDGVTTFALPDLRGEFLRGFDDGRGVDSGRAFGALQLDQMQRITGFSEPVEMGSGAGRSDSGVFDTQDSTGTQTYAASGSARGRRLNFDSANSPNARVSSTTSGETRPRSIALLACIKY